MHRAGVWRLRKPLENPRRGRLFATPLCGFCNVERLHLRSVRRFRAGYELLDKKPDAAIDEEYGGVEDIRADLAENTGDEVTGKKQHQACHQRYGIGMAL